MDSAVTVDHHQFDLSIIIVNFNGESVLDPCLTDIFSSETTMRYEVIVVDNGSQDRSIEILKRWQPRIFCIWNCSNVGFSAANNQGLAVSQGKYVFFLNNDTRLPKTTITALANRSNAYSEPVVLGPRLQYQNGKTQYYGSFLGQWQYWGTRSRSVTFLSGAAIWIPRELMTLVGGFDEGYFFYNEDLELSYQLRKLGVQLIYTPDIPITHLGGVATRGVRNLVHAEGIRGGARWVMLRYPKYVFHIYRVLIIIIYKIKSKLSRNQDEGRWCEGVVMAMMNIQYVKP